ncbi:hypothetical protein S7711_03272 [Stachybotrys chartarum IBT 7711]|uniref:AAA+ ATPase domain-containing protein n=1 Tax=Stachybotrys chartarum (strain CBS 109288 / IBT 7711) TaxID=1280523 RepID=A0A084AZP8_STACB|nr:hypothetical protein S7711_03272 [Stachybotrys chartarum IBT 7711]
MSGNNDSGQSLPPTMDTPQFALLDYLVPGFSVFSRAIQAYLGIDLNLYIPIIIVVFGTIFCWAYLSEYIWGTVEKYLMSSVRIRTDDEIYNMMMMWIADQKFSQRSRRFIVNTNLNSRSWLLWSWRDRDDEDGDGDGRKKALRYTPSFGTHYFWYKGRLLLFERHENREQSAYLSVSEREELTISCFGRNPKIIKELLVDTRENFMKKDQNKTLIYRGASGTMDSAPTWQRCMSRETRPFSTVILNEEVKQELIDDVEDYLDPATRRWYANRGIPYRRGYLLHGPPGTGKSSLSLALAGYFQLRIYIVSLSSIVATEESLSTLFGELPRKCVVLLEDIDSAGLTHTREDDASDTEPEKVSTVAAAAAPASKSKGAAAPQQPATIQRLSLSGLLNILDGVASQEGRVLIMTTNHIEKLDKALIRPGRVDMVVKFGLADAGMSAAIFRAIYVPYEDEDVDEGSKAVQDAPPNSEKVATEKAEQREKSINRIDGLAQEFAAKVPEHEFSPAEIQGLLLRHKHKPEMAIEQVDKWVVQTRKDKKQKELDEAEKRRKEDEERKQAEEKKKKKDRKEKRKAHKQKKSDKKDSSSSASSSEDKQEEEKTKSWGKTSKSKDKKKPDEAKNLDDAGYSTTSSSSDEEEEDGDGSNKSKPKPSTDGLATSAVTADAKNEERSSSDSKVDETSEQNPEELREASGAESKDSGAKKTPSDSGYDT